MTLGQPVFFPSLTKGDDSKHRQGKSDLFGLNIARLILAGSNIFSLGVFSSERRDKVIKILRPMKASHFNL